MTAHKNQSGYCPASNQYCSARSSTGSRAHSTKGRALACFVALAPAVPSSGPFSGGTPGRRVAVFFLRRLPSARSLSPGSSPRLVTARGSPCSSRAHCARRYPLDLPSQRDTRTERHDVWQRRALQWAGGFPLSGWCGGVRAAASRRMILNGRRHHIFSGAGATEMHNLRLIWVFVRPSSRFGSQKQCCCYGRDPSRFRRRRNAANS